jgi:hypothetical protein
MLTVLHLYTELVCLHAIFNVRTRCLTRCSVGSIMRLWQKRQNPRKSMDSPSQLLTHTGACPQGLHKPRKVLAQAPVQSLTLRPWYVSTSILLKIYTSGIARIAQCIYRNIYVSICPEFLTSTCKATPFTQLANLELRSSAYSPSLCAYCPSESVCQASLCRSNFSSALA